MTDITDLVLMADEVLAKIQTGAACKDGPDSDGVCGLADLIAILKKMNAK